LPDTIRVDVITRMANLDDISPDVVARISQVIEQRLKTVGGTSHLSHRGVRSVAELLNRLERAVSQGVLESIESRSPELAVSIRHLMFVFDDLNAVSDEALRQIVQRADRKVLSVALKGATEEIKGRFFHNMSKRAADLIREEIEVMGAVKLKDVEAAQQEIVGVARKLEEEGLLETGAAAGEAYVV
jgi:flagellar motor switch protein FliG